MKHETGDANVGGESAFGAVPADLVAGLALLALADAAVLLLPDGNPLRVAAALPLLLFLPGYALLSTLFPRRGPDTGTPAARRLGGSLGLRARLDWVERLGLSLAVSVSLLPILGVLISLAGFGLAAENLLAVISGLVVLGLVGGAVRRSSIPADERYRLPTDEIGGWIGTELGQRRSLDAALNLALAAVVLVSIAGIGYAFVAPPAPDRGATASILAPDGQGGFHAAGYPETVTSDGAQLAVSIDNGRTEAATFTVVGELQRVDRSDGGLRVLERREVGTWQPTVEAGGDWQRPHTVRPQLQGEDLRLVYYVYRGESAPDGPTVESADKTVQIWVDAGAS